jgi:TetR/AcrR family transcriptional regulator
MTNATEQKILDAALKIFSQKGYDGAKTKIIAKESGFSEVTLFKKFKTKKNLYDIVVMQNIEKIKGNFSSVLKSYKFESSKDFLRVFINDLMKICDDNFEVIHLITEEASKPSEPAMNEWISLLSEYLEKNIKNNKINYPIFTVTILSFILLIIGDKYRGRTLFSPEEAIEKFIDNSFLCIQ